jgi:hypothetical protein
MSMVYSVIAAQAGIVEFFIGKKDKDGYRLAPV